MGTIDPGCWPPSGLLPRYGNGQHGSGCSPDPSGSVVKGRLRSLATGVTTDHRRVSMNWGRTAAGAGALAIWAVLAGGAAKAAGEGATGWARGLPIPRFVSLKADRVNVRAGPTKDNDVTWVYTRAGLPVEITAEFENWRRIRDWEG